MRNTEFRSALVACLGLWLAAAAPLSAYEATITTSDGRVVSGEVKEETAEMIVVNVLGLNTTFRKSEVQSIRIRVSPEEEYARERAKLADNDVAGRLEFARKLYEQKKYAFAKKEFDDLAARAPGNREIDLLRRATDGFLAVEAREAEARRIANTRPATRDPSPSSASRSDLPTTLLTSDQINLLKIYELYAMPDEKLYARVIGSDAPRVTIPVDVFNEVLEKYKDHELIPKIPAQRDDLRKLPAARQLRVLFRIKAEDALPKVKFTGDPDTVKDFKRFHQSYVISYCGTVQCHGGLKAEGFFLFSARPTDEATIYTNYYILNKASFKAGKMINRAKPEDSLLLAYGMEPRQTAAAHPKVTNWLPRFTDTKQESYQNLLRWITSLGPAPAYPFVYALPRIGPEPVVAPVAPAAAPGQQIAVPAGPTPTPPMAAPTAPTPPAVQETNSPPAPEPPPEPANPEPQAPTGF